MATSEGQVKKDNAVWLVDNKNTSWHVLIRNSKLPESVKTLLWKLFLHEIEGHNANGPVHTTPRLIKMAKKHLAGKMIYIKLKPGCIFSGKIVLLRNNSEIKIPECFALVHCIEGHDVEEL
jgi:hypothetical protein